MAKKRLEQCRSDRDFRRYARKQGADVYPGSNHDIIETNLGKTSLPRHGEIGKGLRFTLIKQFIALGITVFFLLCGGAFVIGQMINPAMMIVP